MDRSLWIGTGDGLILYRNHSFRRFGREFGIGQVGLLRAAEQGGVWVVQVNRQVARVGDRQVEFFPSEGKFPSDVLDLIETGPEDAMVLAGETLYEMNTAAGTIRPVSTDWDVPRCRSILRGPTGAIWAWDGGGILQRQPTGWRRVASADPTALIFGRLYPMGDQVWLSAMGRFFQPSGDAVEKLDFADSAPDAYFTCGLVDPAGCAA